MDANRETLPTRIRYGKWAGLYSGIGAAFAHQQINATWIYARCPERTLSFVMSLAIVCATVSIVGGVWSWAVRQSLRGDADAHATTRTDRFLASVSAAIALLGVVFIALSAAAAWFLQCQR